MSNSSSRIVAEFCLLYKFDEAGNCVSEGAVYEVSAAHAIANAYNAATPIEIGRMVAQEYRVRVPAVEDPE